MTVLLVKCLQLREEFVPPGVGIKGKGGSRQDGCTSVPEMTAAKATLDLETIAVFNVAFLLSVRRSVGFVPDGSVGILVVAMAMISLGSEPLAALNHANPAFVFRRTRTDGGFAVFEVAKTVPALGAKLFASFYQTGFDSRGRSWFASRSCGSIAWSGSHGDTAHRPIRGCRSCRNTRCSSCFCLVGVVSRYLLAVSTLVFFALIGSTRLALATSFRGFGGSFDTIVQMILAEALLIVIPTVCISYGLLLAGFHFAQPALEFEDAEGLLCARGRGFVGGSRDGSAGNGSRRCFIG